MFGSFRKNKSALLPILHIPIPLIQNNSPTYSLTPSLFYKFLSPSPIPKSKKLTVKIEENDDVNSNVKK